MLRLHQTPRYLLRRAHHEIDQAERIFDATFTWSVLQQACGRVQMYTAILYCDGRVDLHKKKDETIVSAVSLADISPTMGDDVPNWYVPESRARQQIIIRVSHSRAPSSVALTFLYVGG